jgi:asparagine synthase (glutamine-hydrolysing)
MADTLFHRGPDEDGFFESDGVALANRRLSIIGLADGQQPLHNENRTVHVVMNGELFDYIEQREVLKSQGHQFRTSTDTEIVPHLYEQHGANFLDHVHGQFAICVYDEPKKTLILARDRIGIVPLFFTTVRDGGGEWLLFASEIKALFASGMVQPAVDHAGLNGIFTYFAMPGPRTCFAGITSLPPGHSLTIPLGPNTRGDQLQPKAYWKLDFPDRGQEIDGSEEQIIGRYEELLYAATQRRLRADVPVVSYLSGGIDSSQVVAMAVKALGRPLPTFTIGVKAKGLNEEPEAELVAKHVGCQQVVVPFDGQDVMKGYPELVHTAEMPVMDTACAAMVALAKSVHAHGYKVALTGEGSDEFLAGYPWFKLNRVFEAINIIPGLWLSQRLRRFLLRMTGLPRYPWPELLRNCKAVGGYGPWLDVYGLMSLSRLMFFSDGMRSAIGASNPYEELNFDLDRMAKWHPFHRGMALGIRVMLPGMLLLCKGDRVAMRSSVETRYPFLDDELLAYTCRLHPRWKLRRLTDKYIVRQVGEKWLPPSIARRRKLMFRAPMDCFHVDDQAPPYINQLLSEESLKKTGYFDPQAVRHWREKLPTMMKIGYARTGVEMGLVAVTATQLWHQTFIDSSLADVPRPTVERSALIGQSASANGYHEPRMTSHEPRTA